MDSARESRGLDEALTEIVKLCSFRKILNTTFTWFCSFCDALWIISFLSIFLCIVTIPWKATEPSHSCCDAMWLLKLYSLFCDHSFESY